MKILLTGVAGFIGFHTCQKLLEGTNNKVIGIDNLNSYYSVKLKKERIKKLNKNKSFVFKRVDISNYKSLVNIFDKEKVDVVINLAAQAGVRYSIDKPSLYMKSNIQGFFNILECSRSYSVKHLIYASTSSVYGDNKTFPLREDFNTDKPLSFYAASKKTNEILAYSYSNIYKLPTTGLRFFTVYGPFGRPDMALFKFADRISKNKEIELFNGGDHIRDFTYISDIAQSIKLLVKKIPKSNPPYEIFNIGSNNPKNLKLFLKTIEKNLNKKSIIKKLPLQEGDVHKTHANVTKLYKAINFKPKVNIEEGIKKFIKWYRRTYNAR
jgi:UDP-glucuronate 4-epimerase